MKAKDIALLCTAAAGAGAAAGAAMGTAGRNTKKLDLKAAPKKQMQVKNVKKTDSSAKTASKTSTPKPASALENEFSSAAVLTELSGISGTIEKVSCENDCGIVTIITAEGRTHRAFTVSGDNAVHELRCPLGVIHMASNEECTVFLTQKGGIFVYADPEREPVLCAITAPEYVCAVKGRFCIFSDSLMYICSPDGNICKTVSLGAMIEITDNDICDAENSDDNFATLAVKIKKAYSVDGTPFMTVITAEGKSFLADCVTDGFFGFERTYDNIIDICSCHGFAYYLYSSPTGYGIIKTRVSEDCFETAAKYTLCGRDEEPVKLHACEYGLAVLYKSGKIKFLLPEIADEEEKEKCRSALNALNGAFSSLDASDIMNINKKAAVMSGGKLFIAEVTTDHSSVSSSSS